MKLVEYYSPTTLINVICLSFQTFLYSEAFEMNTTTDRLNHKSYGLASQ